MQKYFDVDVINILCSLRLELGRTLTPNDLENARGKNPNFPSLQTIRRHFGATPKAIKIVEEKLALCPDARNIQKSF